MENYRHFIAGWGAGIFGAIVGHPMDTIKTHQQMSNKKLSTKQATTLIIKKYGFRGLYRGMLFPLCCSGSLNALFFGMYDASLKALQQQRGYNKILPTNDGWVQDLFIAGSIGGTMQAFITCPSELIKIRMQLGKGVYKTDTKNQSIRRLSTIQTVLNINRQYGIRAFFLGFVPTVFRDAIGGGVYILSYQYTSHHIFGEVHVTPGLLDTILAGGVAGIMSWIPVIPFDTVKSRIQADDFNRRTYKGMLDCSLDLFKHTRYCGFFKGFVMITTRSIPVNMSIIYGYELILWFYNHYDIL